jgi:hypothetical protein
MDAYTVLMIARSADWPSKRPDPSAPTVVFVVPSRSVVLEGQRLAMGVLAVGEDSTHRSGQAVQFCFRSNGHPLQPVAPDERDEPRELPREGARQQGRGRAGQ